MDSLFGSGLFLVNFIAPIDFFFYCILYDPHPHEQTYAETPRLRMRMRLFATSLTQARDVKPLGAPF